MDCHSVYSKFWAIYLKISTLNPCNSTKGFTLLMPLRFVAVLYRSALLSHGSSVVDVLLWATLFSNGSGVVDIGLRRTFIGNSGRMIDVSLWRTFFRNGSGMINIGLRGAFFLAHCGGMINICFWRSFFRDSSCMVDIGFSLYPISLINMQGKRSHELHQCVPFRGSADTTAQATIKTE